MPYPLTVSMHNIISIGEWRLCSQSLHVYRVEKKSWGIETGNEARRVPQASNSYYVGDISYTQSHTETIACLDTSLRLYILYLS